MSNPADRHETPYKNFCQTCRSSQGFCQSKLSGNCLTRTFGLNVNVPLLPPLQPPRQTGPGPPSPTATATSQPCLAPPLGVVCPFGVPSQSWLWVGCQPAGGLLTLDPRVTAAFLLTTSGSWEAAAGRDGTPCLSLEVTLHSGGRGRSLGAGATSWTLVEGRAPWW